MRFWVSVLVLIVGIAPARSADTPPDAWTITSSHLTGCRSLNSIAYGNGHFVATSTFMSPTNIAWSRDGSTWQFATTVVPNCAAVVFSSGVFSVLANDGLWQSADGVAWQHVQTFTLNPANPFRSDLLRAGFDSLLIANSSPTGVLLYSPDVVTLRPTTPLPHVDGGTLQVNAIAYVGSFYYVAYTVGQNNTWTSYFVASRDGSDWTDVPWFDAPINAGEMDNSRDYVVAIYAGTVFRFGEGGSGYNTTDFPALGYDHVYFAGNRFFASSHLYASTDGISWGPLAAFSPAPGSGVFDVAYGNGRYVAVGAAPLTDLVAYLDYAGPPTVSVPPLAATVVEGRSATFHVEVDEADATTRYQWKYNGNAIPGATDTMLRLPAVTWFDRGPYSVQINNSAGFTETAPVQLTVVPVTQAGRITNVSVLAPLLDANDTVTVGFVLRGEHATGTKPLLIRAIGPSLAPFGVSQPNPDPSLEWYAGSISKATNNDWGGDAVLAGLFSQSGAFPLSADSKDAAYAAAAVPLGDNSVLARGAVSGGTVLTEVYDYSRASTLTIATPRLLNVSARKSIPAGGHLTAGFNIDGTTSVTVLIRAVGPTLAQFGITDAMRDPRLSLYRQGTTAPLVTNDDWNGAPELAAAFSATGAFGLPNDSKDAAILTTLAPGGYTAQADTADAGSVLVEVYEVP